MLRTISLLPPRVAPWQAISENLLPTPAAAAANPAASRWWWRRPQMVKVNSAGASSRGPGSKNMRKQSPRTSVCVCVRAFVRSDLWHFCNNVLGVDTEKYPHGSSSRVSLREQLQVIGFRGRWPFPAARHGFNSLYTNFKTLPPRKMRNRETPNSA